jgi:hypothetical protein
MFWLQYTSLLLRLSPLFLPGKPKFTSIQHIPTQLDAQVLTRHHHHVCVASFHVAVQPTAGNGILAHVYGQIITGAPARFNATRRSMRTLLTGAALFYTPSCALASHHHRRRQPRAPFALLPGECCPTLPASPPNLVTQTFVLLPLPGNAGYYCQNDIFRLNLA